MERRLRLLGLLLLVFASGFAQDAKKELQAATEAFSRYENLSMEVSAWSYATPKSSSVALIGKGKMCKSKKGYYSRFLDDEMISDAHCTVILNHATKSMYCFDGDEGKRKRSFVPELDSLAATADSLVYKGMVNDMKLIVAYHKNSFILKTEIFIDPSTSLMSRLVYYYPPANEEFTADAFKTEVIYEKISFDEPDESLFATGSYVQRKNKTWVAAAPWSTYHLIVVSTPEP